MKEKKTKPKEQNYLEGLKKNGKKISFKNRTRKGELV